jgi:nitrite reductase/ring-hydroxylating ferredoxin subunit
MTLKLAIENAIQKAAPEVEEVIAEEGAPALGPPLLQIEVAGSWTTVGTVPGAGPVTREIADASLVFVRVAGRLYGYRSRCPACEQSLEGATLDGVELACGACGNRFDAIRAGRGVDLPQLHLEPVPLLEGEEGLVRVALPVAA